MKLRTKILWISCLAVLAATLISGGMILGMTAENLKNEALLKAYQDFYELTGQMNNGLTNINQSEMIQTWLEYFFKTNVNTDNQRGDYTICFYRKDQKSDGSHYKEIYNHTSLSAEELYHLEYKFYSDGFGKSEMQYAGHSYIVFCYDKVPDIFVYRIQDMNSVLGRIRQLGIYIAAITALVITFTILILYFLLKRVLLPLQELNETTKRLAEGDYHQRVIVRSKDEIGQLEESFNKMAEAVENSTQELAESERRKTLFMGNLTHELKTPMTAISGYAQTLLNVKLDREDEEEALHYIYEECGRLERLSKKMMKLLELDQDTSLNLTDIPVRRLFEAAERSCEAILKEKDVRLEILENGEHFLMDMDLMTDVMINLIDNSVKASEKGGRILLRAYDRCIEVQDFGRGIPEEEKEKIMEPFYMIDKSRSRKSGGAGLGLALTAVILKQHNISLKIESQVGEGTRMILQFV